VLSSILKTEAFAIVQIEAMSCGKPIISTMIEGSGVHWVNKNRESGIIVPISDDKAIANAIITLSRNIETYDLMAEGALMRYKKLFTRDNMVAKCLQLYNNILAT